jgi:hypothetical protein
LDKIATELNNSDEIGNDLSGDEKYVENKHFFNNLYLLKQHFFYSEHAIEHFKDTIDNQKNILKK